MQIRRLTYFDYHKLKKLVSYLTDDDDRLAKSLAGESFGFVNAMLPLSMKFKPESFILVEDGEILGLITVSHFSGNPYKINITRLIFKENMYDVGKHLVRYVVNKYGSKGANSFVVTIDECHDELFDLFINGCAFRQCASESLWKIEKPCPVKSKLTWRYAQSSDAKNIAELYNSELINIYKPSLERHEKEFKEAIFSGFNDYYKIRYVVDGDKSILAYLSVTTCDNLNYIIDITLNSGYELDYESLINIALCEIAKKKKAFYPIIKLKKYTKSAEKMEEFLTQKDFSKIQTRQILVKDFYKAILTENSNWNVFLLGENQIGSEC
jgi:hypothetical protein